MLRPKNGWKQVRRCNAYTGRDNVTVSVNGKDIEVKNAELLRSYWSIVGVYDPENGKVYGLPRYRYSPTTSRQFGEWIRSHGMGWQDVIEAEGYYVYRFAMDDDGVYRNTYTALQSY